jgi:hypothetical protein
VEGKWRLDLGQTFRIFALPTIQDSRVMVRRNWVTPEPLRSFAESVLL